MDQTNFCCWYTCVCVFILRRVGKNERTKVGLLLSLKMLLLPLLLGTCLDATTLGLFGCTAEARARFMAQHLVGSLLLHWVSVGRGWRATFFYVFLVLVIFVVIFVVCFVFCCCVCVILLCFA